MKSSKLRGRFERKVTDSVRNFTQSVHTDMEFLIEDIWASEVHTIMLMRKGIISKADARKIISSLETAKKDYENGKFILSTEFEDIHMNVEDYIIRNSGAEYGGKLHTARSRNDQVLTDTKLYLREKILETGGLVILLQETFLDIAGKNIKTIMPGYTHTQHAQPITPGFWATAYVSMLMRDLYRLENAYSNVNINPLGACAISGTSFPIDRELTSKLLGFDGIHEHALDVVSSRDFIAESLSALSILMSNLSKLAEELILWSTYEFGILEISDEYTTGSSIMPQKKNPDVAELIRGRASGVYASLIQILTILKALPMGYNRDLQEDKPLLWNSINTVQSSLILLEGMIKTMKFNEDRMSELVSGNFSTATELANFLVREKCVAFRYSHAIVGNTVKELIDAEKNFSNLDDVHRILKKSGMEISVNELREILDPLRIIESHRSLGGTSSTEVSRMIKKFKKEIGDVKKEIRRKRDMIKNSKKLTERIVKEIIT